jgi:hypothetical protein
MSRQIISALAVITSLIALTSAHAQTISVRPALFKDPVWGVEPKRGEVVLGKTTLRSALILFAVELEEDSVRVPLGHKGNPTTLDRLEWRIGGVTIRPRYRLDLGPKRYTLYFDKNERLVSVESPRLSQLLMRKELAARYPSLRVYWRGHNADGTPSHEALEAPLSDCVSLITGVRLDQGDIVEQLSYSYTCSTKPTRGKDTKSVAN